MDEMALQISSTARFVYESRRIWVCASQWKVSTIFFKAHEVLPVPGGPTNRKKSLAASAFSVTRVKSSGAVRICLSSPYSNSGIRCANKRSRRSLVAEAKADNAWYMLRKVVSIVSCSIA